MRPFAALLLALALAAPAARAAGPDPLGPDVGGPFSLPASIGGRVGDADLAGAPWALFFGFTHCPEVCPLTLGELSLALEELGPEAAGIRAVFVTVDPERDTPAHLAEYLRAFDPRIIGLSGDAAETAAIARAFKATYRKIPLEGGEYAMDHTAIVYLMGRDGRLRDVIDYREPHDSVVAKLRRLTAGGAE